MLLDTELVTGLEALPTITDATVMSVHEDASFADTIPQTVIVSAAVSLTKADRGFIFPREIVTGIS